MFKYLVNAHLDLVVGLQDVQYRTKYTTIKKQDMTLAEYTIMILARDGTGFFVYVIEKTQGEINILLSNIYRENLPEALRLADETIGQQMQE